MNNKEVQDSLKQVGIRLVEEPPLIIRKLQSDF